MSRILAFFALLITSCGINIVLAQEFRATLTGTVADPSGAMIAHATVVAVNQATRQSFRAETTDSGAYFIPYVLPGEYAVTVTAPGFKPRVQEKVVMDAGVARGLSLVLEVGSAADSVIVTEAPSALDTANGSGGTLLTG